MSQPKEAPSKILLLAPVALVLAVYSFAFYGPQQSSIQAAQSRFDTLSAGNHEAEHGIVDTQRKSAKSLKEMRELKDKLESFQAQRDELITTRNRMRQQLESPSLPAATMQRVTSLMEGHRMEVLESQPDSGGGNRIAKVVKPVRDLLMDDAGKKSPSSTDLGDREVYQIKVRGRFQDLQSALRTLSTELEQVLPLSLQMESLELQSSEARQSQRIWTLTILV
ncbi:MAG: hypothetical protein AAFX06_25865 [Planctomycetota bacterium]